MVRIKHQMKNTLTVIKWLKTMLGNKDKFLEPVYYNEDVMTIQFYDTFSEFKTLEYPASCVKFQEYKVKEPQKYYKVFLDCETITNESIHVPYLARFETRDGDKMEIVGEDCAQDLLNDLPDKNNILLIAYNANYDCRLILKYLSSENLLVKGSRFLSSTFVFHRFGYKQQKINITIKDSYKLIDMPLRDFGTSLKFNVAKDILPYKMCTKEKHAKRYVFFFIGESMFHMKDKNRDKCIEIIDKWGCRGEPHRFNHFDITKYASKYCEMDCTVSYKGYGTFRQWMLEHTE